MKYIYIIIMVSLLGTYQIKSQIVETDNLQMIFKKDLIEYQMIQKKSIDTYLLNIKQKENIEEQFVLPVGRIHKYHENNPFNIYVEKDSLIFMYIDWRQSSQEIGKRNWGGYLGKISIDKLKAYSEKNSENKQIIDVVREGKKIYSPITNQIGHMENSSYLHHREGKLETELLNYSFIEMEEKYYVLINYKGEIQVLSIGNNWEELNAKPHKTLSDFGQDANAYMEYYYQRDWQIDHKFPFQTGSIRAFALQNQIYIMALDTDELFCIKEGELQKVNQLPKSLAKEGTLIIDKDADAVYLAPPSNDYKKGAWQNTAINVLNNQAIPH